MMMTQLSAEELALFLENERNWANVWEALGEQRSEFVCALTDLEARLHSGEDPEKATERLRNLLYSIPKIRIALNGFASTVRATPSAGQVRTGNNKPVALIQRFQRLADQATDAQQAEANGNRAQQ